MPGNQQHRADVAASPASSAGRGCSADVVVVGAGLSGMAAAMELQARGRNVLVVEAAAAPGGRAAPLVMPSGLLVDAALPGLVPGQHRLARLARQLGLQVTARPQECDQWHGWFRAGRLHRVPPWAPGPIDYGLPEQVQLAADVRRLAAHFPVAQPEMAEDAARLDSMSFAQWVDDRTWTESGRLQYHLLATASLAAGPHDVSALFALQHIASRGPVDPWPVRSRCGAQAGGLVGRLAARLADRLVCQQRVRAIRRVGRGYLVTTDDDEFDCSAVILAVPTQIVANIEVTPPLPGDVDQVLRRFEPGRCGTFIAVYDQPFWRHHGCSGEVIGDGSPIDVATVCQLGEKHVVLGQVAADEMTRLSRASSPVAISECLDGLVRFFGEQARSAVEDTMFLRWQDPTQGVGRGSTLPPGVLLKAGAVRQPVGGIFWAGADLATSWIGTAEGAVQAGQTAARQAAAYLGNDQPGSFAKTSRPAETPDAAAGSAGSESVVSSSPCAPGPA